MSKAKEQYMEMREEERNKGLAATLGISLDEFNRLDWDLNTNESEDGLVYSYILEFGKDSPKEILNKIERLEDGCRVYLSPWEFEDGLDEEELEWEIKSTEQLRIFSSHLESVENLLAINVDEQTQFNLLVMLQVHIVAAIESFLSSTFIQVVINSDDLTRKLIETDPEFGNRKFSLSEIYKKHEKLKFTVASYLKSLIFHDIKKIKPMYENVLGFCFSDISWLFEAVKLRHDCAHRAGFDKEGTKVTLSTECIRKLMSQCTALSSAIDAHIVNITMQAEEHNPVLKLDTSTARPFAPR